MSGIPRNAQHGMHGTRTYNSWLEMRRRCNDPKRPAYKNYGGRGIMICAEWSDFGVFYADMGPCPDGYQLDRLNNNGNYEPGNCAWRTSKENSRNRRNTRHAEFCGVTKTLGEWAEETGLTFNRINQRLWHGWSVEKTLTTPLMITGRGCRT